MTLSDRSSALLPATSLSAGVSSAGGIHVIEPPSRGFGTSSATLRAANEFLSTHSLSELLPYRSFDPESQLFLNRSSLGFTIETLPLVGCGEDIPRQLTGLFQHTLPLGSNLQCLLIGSGRIASSVGAWESIRLTRSDVLQELAKERSSYLKSMAQHPGGVRNFRLLLSYSEPKGSLHSVDSIIALREQLMTTLKGWGLPVKIWQAEDLLWGLDELLNPS